MLVQEIEYGAAYSALALSFFYLVLAKILFARITNNVRLLVESFLALGVVFGTLAVPLAFDGRWTAVGLGIGRRRDRLGRRTQDKSWRAASAFFCSLPPARRFFSAHRNRSARRRYS